MGKIPSFCEQKNLVLLVLHSSAG